MTRLRYVHLKTQVEGLHHYPGAIEPHAYLARSHRHLFMVEADIQVEHADREVEINDATRWLTQFLLTLAEVDSGGVADFGARSCEHLAEQIIDAILERYGQHRAVRCHVLEDGILGASVEHDPDPAQAP